MILSPMVDPEVFRIPDVFTVSATVLWAEVGCHVPASICSSSSRSMEDAGSVVSSAVPPSEEGGIGVFEKRSKMSSHAMAYAVGERTPPCGTPQVERLVIVTPLCVDVKNLFSK